MLYDNNYNNIILVKEIKYKIRRTLTCPSPSTRRKKNEINVFRYLFLNLIHLDGMFFFFSNKIQKTNAESVILCPNIPKKKKKLKKNLKGKTKANGVNKDNTLVLEKYFVLLLWRQW